MLDGAIKQCIEVCLECHSECTETFSYCLGFGGAHRDENHLRLLLDCAQICATAADFMLRASKLHGMTCGVCAEICRLCAEQCDRFPQDTRMQACARSCRRCAESCGEMQRLAA